MGVARLNQSESPDAADADERLLERCREGSEEAFATLVARYEAQLTRHCARLVGAAAAQDAVQDAFLSAWVALQAGAEVRAARPWLFTIAHRKALAALRDQRRSGVELSEASATSRSPEEVVAESTNVRRAFAALAALPGAQRHALLDSAVHGRSGTQIAHSLGVSESAVRQLVFKARASVRTAAAACLVPPLFVLAALRRALSGAARRAAALHGAASGQLASATLAVKFGALAVVGAAVVSAGALNEISSSSPTHAHGLAGTTHHAGRHRVAQGAKQPAHRAARTLRPAHIVPSRRPSVTAHGVVAPDASHTATIPTATADLSASSDATKATDQSAGTSATTGAASGGPVPASSGTTGLAAVSTTAGTASTTAGTLAGDVTQTVKRVVPDTLGSVSQTAQNTVGAVGQTVENTVSSATGAVGSATSAVTQAAQGAVSALTGATGASGTTGATGATGTTGVTGLLGGLGKLVGGH